MKANRSAGPPPDLEVIDRDTFRLGLSKRIEGEDPYDQSISRGWGDALKKAFDSLPGFSF
jgi:putative proteasome-type protease